MAPAKVVHIIDNQIKVRARFYHCWFAAVMLPLALWVTSTFLRPPNIHKIETFKGCCMLISRRWIKKAKGVKKLLALPPTIATKVLPLTASDRNMLTRQL